ncbi:hypothetical protein [Polaribacter butkevichii]|jgi:hypothetical protein|uniref:Uncharacterized protein n=1 Tax=Polaribacter butkevichii TaxID=218490 RepID=A0A2P6CDD6_9FLAO|nr:hypothetical protein [Polaribacter butkevichii]PQJ72916.1 hypothetical protein BTO14_06450 [Polaribacter butkevichii]
MAYPERKPIYETYKRIITDIIDSKKYKDYANGEIDALDKELLSAFKEIRIAMISKKDWSS